MTSDPNAAATVASRLAEASCEELVDRRHEASSDEAVGEELLANRRQQTSAFAGEVDYWWVGWVAAP